MKILLYVGLRRHFVSLLVCTCDEVPDKRLHTVSEAISFPYRNHTRLRMHVLNGLACHARVTSASSHALPKHALKGLACRTGPFRPHFWPKPHVENTPYWWY